MIIEKEFLGIMIVEDLIRTMDKAKIKNNLGDSLITKNLVSRHNKLMDIIKLTPETIYKVMLIKFKMFKLITTNLNTFG